MAAHSPGPWRECGKYRGGCQCGLVWSVPADAPVVQALAGNQEEGAEYPREVVYANARLIAAAPELLDALRALLDDNQVACMSAEVKQAIALIARIDGEG